MMDSSCKIVDERQKQSWRMVGADHWK